LLSFIEQAEAAQELGVELQPEHVEDRTFDNLVAAGFASVPSEDVYGAKELTVTFTSEPEPVKPKKERKAKAAKAKPATFLEDSSLLSEMMDL
jgi:hypothetical protein